jgi:uncharacterized protein
VAKFLLVVAVFVVFFLFLRNQARKASGTRPPPSASKHDSPSRHGEDMVRCSICGVHLPTTEAVTSRGDFFCSKEHLQLADRERQGR